MAYKKLLGVLVSEETHLLAHAKARIEGKTFSSWMREIINQAIGDDLRDYFFASEIERKEQSVNCAQ